MCPTKFVQSVLWSLPLLALSCAGAPEPPPEYKAQYDEGVQEFRDRNFLAARERFRKLIGDHPDQPFNQIVQLRLAGCEYALGDEKAARRIYQEIVENPVGEPLRILALEDLGMIDLETGAYPAAAARFREALALQKEPKEREHIRYKLAMALQRDGKFQEARQHYEEIIKADPDAKLALKVRSRLKLPDYFTVQVGAYGDKAKADQQVQIFQAAKFDAFIEPVRSGDKILYRVRAGKFSKRQEALNLKDRISDARILPAGSNPEVLP